MRFSVLIHGERDIPPEDIVQHSEAASWNPYIVLLSGADPLFKKENILSFDFFKGSTDGTNQIQQLITDIQGAVIREKYSAVVFLNLSGFSLDLLAAYRSTKGEYAGQAVFSNVVSLVAHALNLSCPVYFHTFTRKEPVERNPLASGNGFFYRPSLGEKTLTTILSRMNFVGFLMRNGIEPVILFKTKTGGALVKDPLGRLSMEKADLGLIQEKIISIIKEKDKESEIQTS